MLGSLKGERREAHWMTYQTAGIVTELVWLQQDPVLGPFSISYHEGIEPERLLEKLMAAQDPYARWLLNQLAAVHGIQEAPEPSALLFDRTISGDDGVRTRYAHAYPVTAEGIEKLEWLLSEIEGPRLAGYEAARRRVGVAREIVWLQQGLTGSYAIYYYELRDVDALLQQIFTSSEPFDDWFGEMFEQIHEIDRTGQIPKANEAVIE